MQYYSSGTGVPPVDHAQDARATTGVDLHRPNARPPSFLPREIHVPIDFTIASCWKRSSVSEEAGASTSWRPSAAKSAT